VNVPFVGGGGPGSCTCSPTGINRISQWVLNGFGFPSSLEFRASYAKRSRRFSTQRDKQVDLMRRSRLFRSSQGPKRKEFFFFSRASRRGPRQGRIPRSELGAVDK